MLLRNRIRRWGSVLVVSVAAGVIAWRWATCYAAVEPDAEKSTAAQPEGNDRASGFKVHAAPEFPSGAIWAQGQPQRIADLKGQVVVLHFWTNACINCIHNYPVYRAWQKKYPAGKLTIIGVHTPEGDFEAPLERVQAKAKENELKFPIVLDSNSVIWRAWNNRFWPTIYLVDKRGQVRYGWEGELHLDTPAGQRFEQLVDELLKEPD